VHYFSYSIGANRLLDADLALFARTSLGGRANAERMLFGGGIRRDGSIAQQIDVNPVRQSEGGVKWRQAHASVFLTAFHSTTQIADQDVTSVTERYTSRVYEANGLELDSHVETGPWRLRGGLTYTVAHIASDHITPQDVGAQSFPHVLYQFSPLWHSARAELGVTVLGTSAVPSNNGGFTVPRFVQTNAYARAALTGHLDLAIACNNVFNRIGITEIDGGGAAPASASGVQTARSIVGRSTWMTLTYAVP
jgi:outer membrane receptor protein involved in Fe transport